MSQDELDKESQEIIRKLTEPKAAQHLAARLIALVRRGIHRYLYEHPELEQETKTEDVVDRIIEYTGSAIEVVLDYDISYKEGVSYENRTVTTYREPRATYIKRDNSGRFASLSTSSAGSDIHDAQKRPSPSRRTGNNSGDDSRRHGDLPSPSDKPKQPKRPRRAKPDSKPESGDRSKEFTDEQP